MTSRCRQSRGGRDVAAVQGRDPVRGFPEKQEVQDVE